MRPSGHKQTAVHVFIVMEINNIPAKGLTFTRVYFILIRPEDQSDLSIYSSVVMHRMFLIGLAGTSWH